MRAEQVRSATVVGKGDKRIQRVEIALDRAVIGFQTPEGGEDRAGDAIGIFNLLEDIGMFDQVFTAFLQGRFRDEALGKFGEGQVENGLLAVAVEHLLLKHGLVQLADALFTNTGVAGFLGQIVHPLAEVDLAFGLWKTDGVFSWRGSRRRRCGGLCIGHGCRRKQGGCDN